MCPLAFSLARNDVSNDVSLSMWRCAMPASLSLGEVLALLLATPE